MDKEKEKAEEKQESKQPYVCSEVPGLALSLYIT